MQKTIARSVTWEGVGVHSGKITKLTAIPAPENHGIIFKRIDVATSKALIPALYDRVVDTKLCTVLANSHGHKVSTVEHLMAAIAALGITNLLLEVDGEELPILDGSSEPFISKLLEAGVELQATPCKVLKILKTVRYQLGDKSITLSPAEEFSIDLTIAFDSKAIGRQTLNYSLDQSSFIEHIAGARTFGFKHEVDYLKSLGLAKGASLENAIGVDGDTVMNHGGLRYEDEFVRHKLLDCIGDLALCGYKIEGRIKAFKAGHELNNLLLRELFKDSSNYRIYESYQSESICIIGQDRRVSALS